MLWPKVKSRNRCWSQEEGAGTSLVKATAANAASASAPSPLPSRPPRDRKSHTPQVQLREWEHRHEQEITVWTVGACCCELGWTRANTEQTHRNAFILTQGSLTNETWLAH